MIVCQGEDHDILCEIENKFSDRTYSGDYFKFIPFSLNELREHLHITWYDKFESYLAPLRTPKAVTIF